MSEGIFKRGLRIASLARTANKLRQLDDEHERRIVRRALANQFADARGVLMKVGQLLVSDEAEDGFSQLVKGIPAIPLDEMQPYLEAALGQPIAQVFSSIDESTHAASLGQVHHARLLDGQEVAVKIQYPDILAKVDAEIRLLGLMPGIGPVKKWGFDLEAYKKSFKQNMDRELNYRTEASTQERFRQGVVVPGLIIPKVHTAYNRPNLLIQNWEQGSYIDEIARWSDRQRKKTGEILVGTLLKSLFETGIVHADPHRGNSYFRLDANFQPEMVLMDFGCTLEISELQRLSLLKLILANNEGLDVSPLRYFAAMGFDATKLAKIGDALPILSRFLFKPFQEFGDFPLSSWNLESNITKLLDERRWWFRSAGPANLFLLMRAFQGIVQQLQILKTSVSWSSLLHQHLTRETLDKARALNLPKLPQEDSLITHSTTSVANKLRVNVQRNGKQLVDISLPAELVLDLESLMPEEVLTEIKNTRSIDLAKINKRIRDSGISPQQVFAVTHGEKTYSVWLE